MLAKALPYTRSRYTLVLYDQDGKPTDLTWGFPSVTEIIDAVVAKPRLLHWYYSQTVDGLAQLLQRYGARLPADPVSLKSLLKTEQLSPYARRDQAGRRGTRIHRALEDLANGKEVEPTDETVGLLNWWEDRRPQVVATEQKLVSFQYGYAGTVDLIYRDQQGRLVLTDLKTSTQVHWTHWLQGEAYRAAWIEQGGEPPDQVSVLHVRSGAELPKGYTEQVNRDISFETFLHIKRIYDALPDRWFPEDIEDLGDQH